MKATIKFLAAMVCIAAMVMAASCSKDNNDGDGNGGNGGGSTSMEFGNYTFGNYHPTKHISRITCKENRLYNFTYTYDFVWEGNNLTKIIAHNPQDVTYEFSYFDNGFIREIKKKNSSMNVRYHQNMVEVSRDFYGDDDYVEYEFDNNGIPTYIGEHEFSIIDGNICGYYDHYESQFEQYDSHPNPFKNFIFPDGFTGQHSALWATLSEFTSPFSNNNRWEDYQYGIKIKEYEDLDGDGESDWNNNAAYPTKFYDNDENITIEYAN